MTFREKVAVYYKGSKGAKRKVAEFFLLNPNEVAFMNAEQVASQVGVSPSTVTRCVTEMGFEGYYDFLDALRNSVKRRMAPKERLEKRLGPDGTSEVFGFRESLESDSRNLDKVLSLNSSENISLTVEALEGAPKINLFTSRSSYPTLSLFTLILSRIRPGVHMLQEAEGRLPEELVDVEPDDLFFVTNLPRYARITLDCAEYAHERGCKVIAVTDSPDSPLVRFANIALYVPYDSYSFFNSHLASLALYNALAVALSLKVGDSSLKRLERHDELVRRFNPLFMQESKEAAR